MRELITIVLGQGTPTCNIKSKILKTTEEICKNDTQRSPTSTILFCPLNSGGVSDLQGSPAVLLHQQTLRKESPHSGMLASGAIRSVC